MLKYSNNGDSRINVKDDHDFLVCSLYNFNISGSRWFIDYVRCDVNPDQLRSIADKIEELNSDNKRVG